MNARNISTQTWRQSYSQNQQYCHTAKEHDQVPRDTPG
jgi:hypothetical protein